MQRGAIADEMEAPEAVRVRLALDPLDLGADAEFRWRPVSRIHLEVLRNRVDAVPELLE
jgi:hypothetical protein